MSDLFDILVANEAFKYLVSEHSKKYIRLAWKNNTYITILGSEGTKKNIYKKLGAPIWSICSMHIVLRFF